MARSVAQPLCCGGRCYKAHHLRMLRKVNAGQQARRFLAELGACERGLTREDLISATCDLAHRGSNGLASQCLTEMGRREMRPSLVAHNALLDAYARGQRWDMGMSTLLRMQELGLQPDARSYSAVVRAGVGSPGSAQLADLLRPQLDAAISRTDSGGGSGTCADLHPEASKWLIAAASSDRLLAEQAGPGEGPGVRMLRQQIAHGLQPDARSFLSVLSGCAKQAGRWQEALQLVGMLEAWVRQERGRAQLLEVQHAFTSGIAACDESGQKPAALRLLAQMEAAGVPLG